MEISKLELFIDLTQTKNFTETAENFYTTQGNVSKQIIALEKELETKLFERSHRKVNLTESGKLTLPFAKSIVSQYQGLKHTLAEHEAKQNQTLTIYTIPTMSNYRGFQKISEFLKRHPEIKIQIQEKESNELFPTLRQSENSILFARTFHLELEEYESIITDKDQFVVLLPKNHPLSKQEVLSIEQLKNEHFLMLGKNTNLYQAVVELCHKAGFEPVIDYEGTRIDLLLNMVASDLGIAVVMNETVDKLLSSQVVSRPLKENQISYLSFIRKPGEHSKASDLFWEELKTNY